MEPKYSIHSPPWQHSDGLHRLMRSLINKGISIKIVGGAVRDAISGGFSKKTDIDLAVDIPPEKVQELLTEFKVIPTGITHGTLTVLVDGQTFEITSLRKDISTNGRHALVQYTKSFFEDAKRRDFTINALYADFDGKVYDPLGDGLKDLENCTIRFVGNAEERIKEDFLRIVRFFRFIGYFCSAEVNECDLKTIKILSPNLSKISTERRWGELQKIIHSPYPIKAMALLIENDIMKHICPGQWDLESLTKIKDWLPHVPDKVFTFLSVGYKSDFTTLPLPLPQKLQTRLCYKAVVHLDLCPRIMYKLGCDTYKDQFVLRYIQAHPFTPVFLSNFYNLLKEIDNWNLPTFPVSGNMLIEKGVVPSPKLGEMLEYLESWWIERNFTPTTADCLEEWKKRYG